MSALWTCQARSVPTRVLPAEIAPDTAGVTAIPHACAMPAQDSRETNAQTALPDSTEMTVTGSAQVTRRALRMDAVMPWAFASATEDLQDYHVTRAEQTCLGSNATCFVKVTLTALAAGPATARACANAMKAGLEPRVTSALLAPSPSLCLSTSLSMSPVIVMRRKQQTDIKQIQMSGAMGRPTIWTGVFPVPLHVYVYVVCLSVGVGTWLGVWVCGCMYACTDVLVHIQARR